MLRAGGTTPKADLIGVNLAAPLADGEQVLVPARLPAAVAAAEGRPWWLPEEARCRRARCS